MASAMDAQIHMDFAQPAWVRLNQARWAPSPRSGVERKRLERAAAEHGRATSVVRYAPGASFVSHAHPGGEEYLVLEGTFSDASGDFRRGTYVRNPIGSVHAPHSANGCTIFVKLCQMHPEQPAAVVDARPWLAGAEPELLLYEDNHERVRLCRWAQRVVEPMAGVELLILTGEVQWEDERLEAASWLRLPSGPPHPLTIASGTSAWMKTTRAHPSDVQQSAP